MRDGWRELTLGAACADGGAVQTGPFGSQLHASDYVVSGIPVVMPVNIGDNRIVVKDVARVPTGDADRLARHKLRVGDIVYSRRGDIKRRARVREGEAGWLCGTGCLLVRPGPAVDARWLSYWLGTPSVHDWLERHAVGATMPNLSTKILYDLPVDLPPLDEQRRIAGVLGVLDDLIETNQRMCAAIAQLSRDLFSVLLPESAVVTRLGDIAAVNPDEIKPGAGDIRYLDIAALRDGGMDEPRSVSWSEAPSRARRGAVGKDILWSTVRPNRRGHTLLLESHDDLVVSTGIAVIRAQEIGFAQLYASTDRPEFVDFLMSRAEGSAYPAVRPLDIEAAPIPVLGSSAAARYEAVMAPLWEAVGKLRAEKEQARQTRDELLPLLMSGAVSPGEIEVAS